MSHVLVTDHLNGCGCSAMSKMPPLVLSACCGLLGQARAGHLNIKAHKHTAAMSPRTLHLLVGVCNTSSVSSLRLGASTR